MAESDSPVEVTLEGDGEEAQPADQSPLAGAAHVVAALINEAPDVLAVSHGTRVEVRSAGVLVKMTVTAISADAEDVLQDE